MTEQEQIDALKAQVNCLREYLEQLAKLGNGEHHGNSIGNIMAIKALETTPEQCLAEVKSKAIEDYKNQLAESKQLDLATKIMTVTV